MRPPLLEVKNLSRYFGRVKALDGISFSLEEGQTLAIVGESGCGKTTAIRLLLALDRPTAGHVEMHGRDIAGFKGKDLRKFRSDVQAVFQDPWSSLNPRIRVRDLIAEPLRMNSDVTKAEAYKAVDKVLRDVGLLEAHAQSFAHEFSGGQRQRIAIASALISKPKVIVLDEPVSALDGSVRAQIMNLLKDLQLEYGISFVLVAHDLGTAKYMADHVAVMYLGRVVEYGVAQQVFAAPQHPYTLALMSAALPAHPRLQKKEIILRGEVASPIDVPPGCHFHPRCQSFFGDICATQPPELLEVLQGHLAACHLCHGAT